MENEFKTIHDFQLEIIYDYYSRLERQGPGSRAVTQKALSFIEGLTADSQIADIGCGLGTQTLYLAESTKGYITASDIFPGFIDRLKTNAAKAGLGDRVTATVEDMCHLPYAEEQFDLIWSEGAIYNVGFEKGLNEWRKLLKPGGYIAVSEASWFASERPKEIHDFWMANYPEIDLISTKIAQMERAGYKVVANFIEPEECWIDEFYTPAEAIREAFLRDHGNNQVALDFVESERYEQELYMKYKEYYGYVFYIGQKI